MAQKYLCRVLVEYHHRISAALNLVSGEATSGFAFEGESGVGIFGIAAGLKPSAGGGSATNLDIH